MSDTKLEPCPCCGSNNDPNATGSDAILLVTEKHNRWFVCCNPCGMRTAFQGSQSAAIAAWNQRAGWRTDWENAPRDSAIAVHGGVCFSVHGGVLDRHPIKLNSWGKAWWADGEWRGRDVLFKPTHYMLITSPTEAGGKS